MNLGADGPQRFSRRTSYGRILEPVPLEGKRFAGFEVQRELGRGGMGIVYLARQPSLNRLVAVKVLSSGAAHDESMVKRFIREARTAAALTHQSIVPVFDFGHVDGIFYLVTPYMAGGSLLEALAARRLHPPEVAAVGRQVAGALGFAHSRNVVHRDVKPSNLLLDGEGNTFLADFGIVALAGATQLTDASVQLGTVGYMAPELAMGAEAGPASDIYALGITLYECLTGSLPFDGEDMQVVLYQHRFEPVPPLPETVPEPLAAAIRKALSKDPSKRFADAAAFRAALEASRSGAAPRLEPASGPAAPPEPPITEVVRGDRSSQLTGLRRGAHEAAKTVRSALPHSWPPAPWLGPGVIVAVLALLLASMTPAGSYVRQGFLSVGQGHGPSRPAVARVIRRPTPTSAPMPTQSSPPPSAANIAAGPTVFVPAPAPPAQPAPKTSLLPLTPVAPSPSQSASPVVSPVVRQSPVIRQSPSKSPTGGIITETDCSLSETVVKPGDTVMATTTIRLSATSSTIALPAVALGARPPGTTHAFGPSQDFLPHQGVTLSPNIPQTITATRTFTQADPPGQWYCFSTYETGDGVWHDGNDVTFSYAA